MSVFWIRAEIVFGMLKHKIGSYMHLCKCGSERVNYFFGMTCVCDVFGLTHVVLGILFRETCDVFKCFPQKHVIN